jgi:succinoglycan biosynthesis protein ExoA
MNQMTSLSAAPRRPAELDGLAHPAAPPAAAAAFVSIVVPALNEEAYIEACLRSLLAQWPAAACEILVMDGGSTDRTPEIVAELARRHPQLRLLHNPRRIQSAAMNLAARLASPRATILVRADAHAHYPPGFVRRCVAELLRTGATSVVVPMRTEAEPDQGLQRAIAAAQSSRLGNGGSAHRAGAVSGFVDHGHHAAFDRAFFLSIGGYDESFTHNEDAELDHRAALAGGRVWMCAEAPVVYFPRKRLEALGRQYLRHGRGRARMLMKHGLRPRPRQMAPLLALGGSAGALALAPLLPALAALALPYPLLCLLWGFAQALRRRDPWLLAAGPALLTMHLGWAAGFLQAALRSRQPGPAAGPAGTAVLPRRGR